VDYSPLLVMKTLDYVSSLMWMQIPIGHTAAYPSIASQQWLRSANKICTHWKVPTPLLWP